MCECGDASFTLSPLSLSHVLLLPPKINIKLLFPPNKSPLLQIARKGGGLRAYNYPIMVIGPEDAAGGWCIVIGLRSNLLDSNAQVSKCVCMCGAHEIQHVVKNL